MVSTRGGKVKFVEGERVLCYEPDPTKAKVLYDSKVLQIIQSKDLKGRKCVEYLIHFQGWNSTWDRRVTEDFVLKYTDENRELQKDLAEKAHIKLSIKSNRVLFGSGSSSNHRRKRRLSETIRETIERERKDRAESDTSSKTGGTDGTDDDMTSVSSEVESSIGNENEGENMDGDEQEKNPGLTYEEAISKDIPFSIPEPLKAILLKDYYQINEKNRLVNLPSEKPILSILEEYVKFFALRYLARSNERRKSENKEKDRAFVTLDLCKEFVDGLRICFDFYVHTLLLYAKERNQAERIKMMTPFKIEKKHEVSLSRSPTKEFSKEIHTQAEEGRDTKSHHKNEKEDKKSSEALPRRVLRSQKPASEDASSPTLVGASSAASSFSASSLMSISVDVAESKESSTPRSHIQNQTHSCDSGRGTPSTITSGGSATVSSSHLDGENLPSQLLNVQDLQSWTLLPEAFRTPTPPVLIYGSIHLLRLIVKMPEILYKMNLTSERKKIILHHMDMFLEYLNSHTQPYFSELPYINNTEFKE